jgi:hypothetical protein
MLTKQQLPPPESCDNCQSLDFKVVINSVIYGKERGDWPYGYFCCKCRAFVGCHYGNYNPLGKMATASVRRRRSKLHELFDVVWQEGWIKRSEAYRWLAGQLNLDDVDNCHIGELSKENLEAAITLMQGHKAKDYALFRRRKEKEVTKKYEQRTRENARIGLRKSRRA